MFCLLGCLPLAKTTATVLNYGLWAEHLPCHFQDRVLFVGNASAFPARESHQQKMFAHSLGKDQGYFILVFS